MTFDGWPLAIVLLWLFVLGASLGSFLNVCIYRIPQHERFWDQLRGLVHPPSTCPKCRTRILKVDNVPIFGWLRLRGRCRNCQGKISPRYPLIETLNGLLFVLVYVCEIPSDWGATAADSCVYFKFGPQILDGPWSEVVWLHLRYLCHMVMIESLVVATFIDFDLRIIPDGATLPAMAFGIISNTAFGQVFLVPVAFQSPSVAGIVLPLLPEWLRWPPDAHPQWILQHPHWHGLAVSVAGLIVGGGVIWAVRLIGFQVLKQEAMGFGDVVLMAMIGSFIGWQPVVAVFFIAPICALLVVAVSFVFKRQREIPYGPYLSLGALVLILGFPHVWPYAELVFDFGPGVIFYAAFMIVGLFVCLSGLQVVKRWFGFETGPPRGRGWEWSEDWSAADQLAHYANERDEETGLWRTPVWPGKLSGRGRLHEDNWRNPS